MLFLSLFLHFLLLSTLSGLLDVCNTIQEVRQESQQSKLNRNRTYFVETRAAPAHVENFLQHSFPVVFAFSLLYFFLFLAVNAFPAATLPGFFIGLVFGTSDVIC